MRVSQKDTRKLILAIRSNLVQAILYLVGNQFSIADLSVASLLAPLCRPEKYGLDWPEQYPEPLQSYIDSLAEQLQWVHSVYKEHR